MSTITGELLEELKCVTDIEEFFSRNSEKFINETTSGYLNELVKIRDLSISEIAKASGKGEYVYKVFNGDRKPSRDVLIAIAFGMSLSLEETQLLLRITKFAVLDSRDVRDSIIIYGLTHNMSLFQTDDALNSKNLTTIN